MLELVCLLEPQLATASRSGVDAKLMVGMSMVGMGHDSHFRGPINGILCIFLFVSWSFGEVRTG